MAQNRPFTSAAQNFFSQFNAAQNRRRIIEVEEQRRQAILDAATLKRQQDLEDRENLALSIENTIGIDTGGNGVQVSTDAQPVEDSGIFPSPQITDGIVEEDITEGGVPIPGAQQVPERRGAGRQPGFTFNSKQRKAFSQAVAINPSVSAPILNFLTKANDFQLQEEANRTARNLRGAVFLQDQVKKSPVLFQQGIKQLVESGLYGPNEVQELVRLSNETNPDLVNLKLEKLVLDNTPKKTILEEEVAKRKEARAVQPGFTLSEGQRRFGPGGKEIARVAPTPIQETTLVRNLQAAGIDPKSVEGIDIIKKSLTKPGVKIDLNEGLNFKIPLGFMLLDKNDPTKGVTPIPGGPKDNLSAENAAKAQMLRTALRAFKGDKDNRGARSFIFDKDGALDRTNLFNASFNTPFTEGRRLRNLMEFGIQAITRAETGAAMPPEEVENTRTRFMPTIGDTVEIATTKLAMFEEFLGGTLKLLDPSGRFLAERFDAELNLRVGGGRPTGETTSGDQPTSKFTIKRVR